VKIRLAKLLADHQRTINRQLLAIHECNAFKACGDYDSARLIENQIKILDGRLCLLLAKIEDMSSPGSKIGAIRVGNINGPEEFKPALDEVVFFIGRPNILGNPFKTSDLGSDYSREEAIELFRRHLVAIVLAKSGPEYAELEKIVIQLLDGQDVILMCHCAPQLCHGNIIVQIIDRMVTGWKCVHGVPAHRFCQRCADMRVENGR
jgi:Domain of unknown function (DUF4326)